MRKRKYGAESYPDNDPSCELAQILERLDSGQHRDEDFAWLRVHRLSQAARKCALQHAQHYENLYKNWGNLWDASQCSSRWRDADQPQQAIVVTSYALEKLA